MTLARDELTRLEKLAHTGAISALKIKEKESALQAALARREIAQAALNPSNAEITIAKEQIKRELAQGKAIIAALRREKELLSQKQAELQNQLAHSQGEIQQILTELEKTMIRTPVSGTIQHLNLRNSGQVVSASQAIALITMRDAPLIVKSFVESANIEKISIGQPVRLKVTACPYPDYGILQGSVTYISPDTIFSQQPQASYEVNIQPKSFSLNAKGNQCNIKPGMEATASFITQEETILLFVLRKARLLTDF
ncbi:Secretion protein HlyD family protein (fragment) [Hyella patelloides LEGE 07179]|uniref:Secretion protein HlyD family protein n=1 Tax=Hyella patelloides LEGE 07179 TaxID=945734 RepID=A0A563VKM5_9CYAN